MDQTISFLHYIHNFSDKQAVSKADSCSRSCLFSRLYQCLPDIICSSFQKKHFYLCSGVFLCSDQSGRNYFRIIDNQTISWIQFIDNLTKYMMLCLPCLFIKYHKAGGRAVLQRILCDQFLRKIIIKITCFQCSYPLFLLSQLNTKFFQTGKNAIHCCCNFSFFQCLILCTEYDRISN